MRAPRQIDPKIEGRFLEKLSSDVSQLDLSPLNGQSALTEFDVNRHLHDDPNHPHLTSIDKLLALHQRRIAKHAFASQKFEGMDEYHQSIQNIVDRCNNIVTQLSDSRRPYTILGENGDCVYHFGEYRLQIRGNRSNGGPLSLNFSFDNEVLAVASVTDKVSFARNNSVRVAWPRRLATMPEEHALTGVPWLQADDIEAINSLLHRFVTAIESIPE